MNELGRLALLLGFICSVFAVGSIAWGLRTGYSGPLRSGRRAVWTVCALALLAVILLERALLARDMSYRYVAEHTSKDLPLHYAFTSLWAGQEGSLLLWLLILSGFFEVMAPMRGGTAWWAHIGGFVTGLFLILLFRPRKVSI